jgi:putative PIN family toxin of toxin-antitoxin system
VALSDRELELKLSRLETIADLVTGKLGLNVVVRDAADLMFLAAAVEARAEYIVTGDADLLTLEEYEGINIVMPLAFLDLLSAP